MSEEKTTWLPTVLFDIAQVFGLGRALTFAGEFGGRRVYIPKTPAGGAKIAAAVGHDLLEWLVERYGGENLLVPLGEHSGYSQRIAQVRRLVDQGESASTITKVAAVHRRTVQRHRAKVRDDDQGGLF
jgi:hypothetical protein